MLGRRHQQGPDAEERENDQDGAQLQTPGQSDAGCGVADGQDEQGAHGVAHSGGNAGAEGRVLLEDVLSDQGGYG